MRRLLIALTVLLAVLSMLAVAENREWTPNPLPGDMYFVDNIEVAGGSYTLTNNAAFMWYPALIRFTYGGSSTNTAVVNQIVKLSTEQYVGDQVITNDIGGVETNYNWGLTNTVETLYTNEIGRSVSTNATTDSITCENEYFQRGDILNITWSETNTVLLRIVGKR